jgi:hypothetical protein
MKAILAIVLPAFLVVSLTSHAKNMQVDENTQHEILSKVKSDITDYYIFPEVAKKIDTQLLNAKYKDIVSAEEFVAEINKDLQEISHDKHLRLQYSSSVIPVAKHIDSIAERLKKMPQAEASNNFGFTQAMRLEGNVGYLSFDFFAPPAIAAKTVSAAMEFLLHTDSMIIDLRKNIGGDPDMVSYIASYFFDKKPVHLNDIHWRENNRIDEYWSLKDLPGERYLNKRVYILTSQNTFSAAEEFAYDLKALKRATIIGERTAGGAHPANEFRINDHFSITIPNAKAVNPITKTNWEGTGVKPDIEASQDTAFDVAYKLAKMETGEQK